MQAIQDFQVTQEDQINEELVVQINKYAEAHGASVRVKNAGSMGRGLFAARDIKEGESITKYGGRMLRPGEPTSGPYVYAFDEQLFAGILQDPSVPDKVKVDVRASIDAWRGSHIDVKTHFKLSEMGRWVNSVRKGGKQKQNVIVAIAGKNTDPVHGPAGRWDIEYVAITRIRKGEQLFTDYGPQYWVNSAICSLCSSVANDMCARCNAPYCGRECQKLHWPVHAVACVNHFYSE